MNSGVRRSSGICASECAANQNCHGFRLGNDLNCYLIVAKHWSLHFMKSSGDQTWYFRTVSQSKR